ncbi:hypothetical protein N7474_007272 [Penicillium riverlandense]|uniref:uncharacterized protein n=1 Tax=Penicillium riverlandense TaxID=1903569 RepID=UPI00254858E4|nr:uncharacterized protein N7474_007272 [Penicillium riverlandense]KAJ5815495.1 hypothetical protein N7474_007272 [Penicillium riverlandense]
MIPPCDPSILAHNPLFKRLYENLTTTLFNPDGSTRAHSALPERERAVEDLKQCQTQHAKKRIKERMLRRLAFASDSGLPDECRDNLAIISLYLETPRAAIDPDRRKQDKQGAQNPEEEDGDDALSLLAPDIEAFHSHIPTIARSLSTLLSSSVNNLRNLATAQPTTSPETPPTGTGGIPTSLSRSIHAPVHLSHHARARARDRRVRTSIASAPPVSNILRERVRALRQIQLFELPTARRQMAATAADVLATRTLVLERTVITLERVKHGALARATKAKAEHLATVAQGVEGKLEVTKLEITASIYTPETLAALTRYRDHLRKTRDQLEERRMMAIEELRDYGDVEVSDGSGTQAAGDGGTLAEIARRYGALAREVETVKMEIARLGE